MERAFGAEEGADLADLVAEILSDRTAEPTLSLIATENDRAVGHILYSATRLSGQGPKCSSTILAPLAVVPAAQRQGVGGKLIAHGLQHLSRSGTGLVFVLGPPDYYPRHGFEPAAKYGLKPPYSIPVEHADAWMVQVLQPDALGSMPRTVLCCDALSHPRYWEA